MGPVLANRVRFVVKRHFPIHDSMHDLMIIIIKKGAVWVIPRVSGRSIVLNLLDPDVRAWTTCTFHSVPHFFHVPLIRVFASYLTTHMLPQGPTNPMNRPLAASRGLPSGGLQGWQGQDGLELRVGWALQLSNQKAIRSNITCAQPHLAAHRSRRQDEWPCWVSSERKLLPCGKQRIPLSW
jgi:hypothetical protein